LKQKQLENVEKELTLLDIFRMLDWENDTSLGKYRPFLDWEWVR
jgi:hypothetical protein